MSGVVIKALPRVTEIISWGEPVPVYYSEAGRVAGTIAHRDAEAELRGEKQGGPITEFLKYTGFQPVEIEAEMADTYWEYRGRPDAVLEGPDGGFCVLELKNKTPDMRRLRQQCAAYRQLVSRHFGVSLVRVSAILLILSERKSRYLTEDELRAGWRGFRLKLQEYWSAQRGDQAGMI